jgi:hypothetical protein
LGTTFSINSDCDPITIAVIRGSFELSGARQFVELSGGEKIIVLTGDTVQSRLNIKKTGSWH